MSTVRDDGIVDLTGRGLQFLLSFDMSQARRSIEEITPTMDGFLKVLKSMKDEATSTAQSIADMFKTMSSHSGEMGLMAMIGGDPSKMHELSAAVMKFHREAQAGARLTQQEYATLFREILRLAGGFDDAQKASEKLNSTKMPDPTKPLPGGPNPAEGGVGGGLNSALGAASGLAGMVGLGTVAKQTLDQAADISDAIQRLGQQYKLSKDDITAWKEGIAGMQSTVGGTTKEILEMSQAIMQTSDRLHTIDMAKPFVEAAAQVSRLTGVSGTDVAKLIGQYEQFGLVTKDTVKDFVGDMYEATQKGAGAFGDIAKNVQEAGNAMHLFYKEAIQPGGAFEGKTEEARKYYRDMAVEMASLMNRLKEYGVEGSIVTKAGEAMRHLTDDQTIQLRQFLQSATNMTQEEAQKLEKAMQMGDVSQVIQQLAKSVQGIPGGWERLTKDLPQMFAGAVTGNAANLFTAMRGIPLDKLAKLAEILPGITDGVKSLDRATQEYNASFGGSRKVFGEAIESLRTMHATWLDSSGVGQKFYEVLTSIVNLMKEFPNFTRIATGVGLLATAAVALSGAFRLVGAAAPWIGTLFPSLASALGVGGTAAAGSGGLIGGFGGLAGAVKAFTTSLLSVETLVGAAVLALGYLLMKATGLDEKLKNADWARAFRDLKDEAQATLRVLEQVADWGWEKILKLTEAIDQKLESWAGKIRAAASALLDMIPGGERLKNMLDLNTNRPAPSGGAAAGAAPDANTSTAEMIIKGAMGLFAPKFTLLVEALRMLNDTVIADGASRRTSEQLLNDERAKSNAGRVELSSSRTPTIDTGSLARQIAMQLPANATAGSAKSVVENGVSIRQVTADMNQQALMEKIASMAGNISAIAMNTSSGAASQRTAPQAIMVPAPRQTQAVSAVDNGRATFAQLQELISQQANAAKPQPFPDRIKADTSDLAQVIREVAAQVANQVAMGQQSSKQLMPAGGYDSGMPWSPKVTSGSQEA